MWRKEHALCAPISAGRPGVLRGHPEWIRVLRPEVFGLVSHVHPTVIVARGTSPSLIKPLPIPSI